MTVVSGAWPRDSFDAAPAQVDGEASLIDSVDGEPVEPDSPEGQLILVEAVRTLERRLSPEARASVCTGQDTRLTNASSQNGFLKLRSFYQSICRRALCVIKKEK